MAKRIRNSNRTQLFFEHIVELCIEAGLVWGEELYIDATEVKANASARSVLDRTNAVLAGALSKRYLPPGTVWRAVRSALRLEH